LEAARQGLGGQVVVPTSHLIRIEKLNFSAAKEGLFRVFFPPAQEGMTAQVAVATVESL